jgi:hypothetical protein
MPIPISFAALWMSGWMSRSAMIRKRLEFYSGELSATHSVHDLPHLHRIARGDFLEGYG